MVKWHLKGNSFTKAGISDNCELKWEKASTGWYAISNEKDILPDWVVLKGC